MTRWIMCGAGVLVLLVFLAVKPARVGAQEPPPLNAGEFWARLDQTQRLAGQALAQDGSQRADTLRRMNDLWTDVQAVGLITRSTGRVEQIIPVDVSWLRIDANVSDDALRILRERILALLQFQRDHYGDYVRLSMLDTLDQVLQDERFQYGDERPAPVEEPNDPPDTVSNAGRVFSPSLAQIILMVIGVIAVVLFASYLFQFLQIQPAMLDSNGDIEDIPATSIAAHDRADEAMSSGDYRAAIRYLYLASLLLLDERDVIRFSPSLTNTEHLRQITSQPEVRGLLERIVTIFDRVWYGFAPVDDQLYRHFRHMIDQLQQVTRTP